MMRPYRPAHSRGAQKRATREAAVASSPDDASDAAAREVVSAPLPAWRSVLVRWWSRLRRTPHFWAKLGAAAVAVVIVVAAAIVMSLPVTVPSLRGLSRGAADKKTTAAGLVLVVKGTVLSESVPKGEVASQDPTAGVGMRRGSIVVVLISAGSGTFAMPNVLGLTVDRASAVLQQSGLVYEVDSEPSVAPSGTIVDSVPGAGELVRSGDTVHLTIASNAGLTVAQDLTGVAFVLDPDPPQYLGGQDVAYDVATRVGDLLRLAGASVTITRGALGSSSLPGIASRAAAARSAGATAVVGFAVGSGSVGGVQVAAVPSSESSLTPGGSTALADSLTSALLADFPGLASATSASDPVLTGAGHPSVRITLGSTAVAADVAAFGDTDWAQKVAHDIYLGLAAVYGKVAQ